MIIDQTPCIILIIYRIYTIYIYYQFLKYHLSITSILERWKPLRIGETAVEHRIDQPKNIVILLLINNTKTLFK